ncbi:actin filament organization protein-like protein App1-like protein [Saccharata proteae CBS 121410]|uniref:Actin filament organization protein-like protein App1-like protein n=1 Tax=Saccharata proteae CBS 121410 TaxID=1314787 RepID=A0A9P4HTD4_9PEZI|nr:actin filament organization protein-like protein App1-like protein [Saccharata proteae CBS 121410]
MDQFELRTALWQYETKTQQTDEEKKLRELANFLEVEEAMPSLPNRLRGFSLFDRFTSWMGASNPFAKPVDGDQHAVWLQDNIAGRPEGADNTVWEAEFVAAYFIRNTGKDSSKIVANIAGKLGLGEVDESRATIAKRLEPWVEAILPAHTVKIRIGDKHDEVLGPSDRSGVSTNVVQTRGTHEDGSFITSKGVDIKTHPMTTTFAEPTGWAVISDIDDTIKVTMTSSPLGILKSTFVDTPTPVKGMPEFYAHLRKVLKNPPFWYLSASPYNLYPFLRDFRTEHYPTGPLLLREASWMNLAGFLTSLTAGTQAYKVRRMKVIHKLFPRRMFMCIGDSTQSDPEAYGEMARKHPGWIGGIFIRKVTGVAEIDEAKKNVPERFEKAFKDVPKEIWYVFEDPAELYGKVSALMNQHPGGKSAGN